MLQLQIPMYSNYHCNTRNVGVSAAQRYLHPRRGVQCGYLKGSVMRVRSDTFGDPIFQNFTKLVILPDHKCSGLICLALPPHQKSDIILPFEKFLKLKLPKNHFNKKCAPNFLFFNDKKVQFWHFTTRQQRQAKHPGTLIIGEEFCKTF